MLDKLKSNFKHVKEFKKDYVDDYVEHFFIINQKFKWSRIEHPTRETTGMIFVTNLDDVHSTKYVWTVEESINALKELIHAEKRKWAA